MQTRRISQDGGNLVTFERYCIDLATQAKEVANRGEQGQVYKITIPTVDKQGRLLTTETEQEARWAGHFSKVLNRLPSMIEADMQDPDTDLDVSATPLQGSYRFSETNFQDFSRTFPGLRLIIQGL